MFRFNLPAIVQYKSKQFIAYKVTEKGKVKLITWNDKWEFSKYSGTPGQSAVDILRELGVREVKPNRFFKVQGKVFSCATGDEMVAAHILDRFKDAPETLLHNDREGGVKDGIYSWDRHQIALRKAAAVNVPVSGSVTTTTESVISAVTTVTIPVSAVVDLLKEVSSMKENLQHLVDVERIKEISSSSKVKGVYGRDYHMIRLVSKGRAYRVFTMDKSKDTKQIISSLEGFLIITVDKPDTVLFAVAEEPTRFLGWFREFGFGIKKGSKTSKRVSQFIRPYLIFAGFDPKQFTFKILNKENWSGDFRTVDGCNVISTKAFKFLLAVTVARLTWEGDHEAAQLIEEMGRENVVFNGRLWLPSFGFIKGQFFVSSFIDVDFIIHEENIKSEVTVNTTDAYIGLDPQPGKLKLDTNGQSCNNFPMFHGIGHEVTLADNPIYQAVVEACVEAKERLKSGKLETSLKELLILLQNDRIEESETTRGRIDLARWSEFDSVKSNPALFGREAKDSLRRLVDVGELNINVRVQGGTYCQTVSESVMALIGVPCVIANGTVQYNSHWMLYVVSDADYIHNLPNHGGPDMDDKFCQILCMQEGYEGIRCFMYRNPSDRGEFNVLTFVGVPPVKISSLVLPAKLPLKLTERDWKLPEVPSSTRAKVNYGDADWSIEDFYKEVDMTGANPGLGINVGSLWNASNPDVSLRNQHMPSNEQQVDSLVQLRDGEDIAFISRRMNRVVREVLNSNWVVDYRRLQNCIRIFPKDVYANWVAKLKADKRLPEEGTWWTQLVVACGLITTKAIKEIDEEIELVRVRNDYNRLMPLKASQLQMVADYVARMMRVQGACGRTAETKGLGLRNTQDSITEKGHDWIAKGMKVHFNALCDQFVKWGLVEQEGVKLSRTPVRVAIAMAHVVNNHAFIGRKSPIVTDWLMNRKEYFTTYMGILKAYKKATAPKAVVVNEYAGLLPLKPTV